MNLIELYHGSTEIISRPLSHAGGEFQNFGKGFYVTNFKDQALERAIVLGQDVVENWLQRKLWMQRAKHYLPSSAGT